MIAFNYYQQQHRGETGIRAFPGYYLIQTSPFVNEIRMRLTHKALPFSGLVKLFGELFRGQYKHEPEDPKSVVEAYLSVIDYLNAGCAAADLPLILDYRIHLILNDISEALTRCLQCGHYHDSRCLRCQHCNGLLFKVSKQYPDKCIAYLVKKELYPGKVSGKQVFSVLISIDVPVDNVEERPVFRLLEHVSYVDEEGYEVQAESDPSVKGITIEFLLMINKR
jgi:hypothetical protein